MPYTEDKSIAELDAVTTLDPTDIFPVVTGMPAGPASKQITWAALKALDWGIGGKVGVGVADPAYQLDVFTQLNEVTGGSGAYTLVQNYPGAAVNAIYEGMAIVNYFGSGANADTARGLRVIGSIGGSATSVIVEGINAIAQAEGSGYLVAGASLYGVRAWISNTGTGRFAHAMALKANAPINSGGGTLDSVWGLYISDQDGVSAQSAAIHIEGKGLGNGIEFGDDGSGYSGMIWHRDSNEIEIQPISDYNLAIRLQSTIGGSATTIGLHAINDAADAWKDFAIEGDTLSLNAATRGLVTVGGGMALTGFASSPPSGASGVGKLYVDTSGAKAKLMCIFPSGAAQQIAIEP